LAVIHTEAGAELPIGPAYVARLSLTGYVRGPTCPGCHAGLEVCPELAQVDWAVVLFAPLRRHLQVEVQVVALAQSAFPCGPQPLLAALYPFRALVSELEWQIVVEGHDQVTVIGRELQIAQPALAIPVHWPDNDIASRVALANGGDGLGQHLVPGRGADIVWLVQQFEEYVVG